MIQKYMIKMAKYAPIYTKKKSQYAVFALKCAYYTYMHFEPK